MPDIAALVTPPLLLDSTGQPAHGDIYVSLTADVPVAAGIATPTRVRGLVTDGTFTALDGSAFNIPVTPEGVGARIFVELREERPPSAGNVRAKYAIKRTVSVPDQVTVTWADLVDMVPVDSGTDYVIPSWVAALEARVDEAVAAAASVDAAVGDAVAAKDAAVEAKVAAEAVGTTNDTVIAGRINDSSSATATALSGTYATKFVYPAGGTQNTGSVVKIGPEGAIPSNVATAGIVGGGAPNYENVIGGVLANVNTTTSNIPVGGAGTGIGALTAPDGNWNWIWGGYDNVVNGWANQLHGYHCKIGNGANHNTIGGGITHEIAAAKVMNTIAGGSRLKALSDYGSLGGGHENTVSGIYGTVAGGSTNTATAAKATVGGGLGNDATGGDSTVAGGLNNDATGSASSISGGSGNLASGNYATVVGGFGNIAAGESAVATGRQANAVGIGMRAHASGAFAVAGDAQTMETVLRATTTAETPVELYAASHVGGRLTIPSDTTWFFEIIVVARRTDVDGESASYKITGTMDRGSTGGSTALVGPITQTVLVEDSPAWDVVAAVTVSDATLRVTATGEAAKNIRWVAHVRIVQVSG